MASRPRPPVVRPSPPARSSSQSPDTAPDVSTLSLRLQTAIERGHKEVASQAATQLAKQRACLGIEPLPNRNVQEVRVKVHIEDREQRAGHVIISVSPSISIRGLKNKIFQLLGLPPEVQCWLVGRSLGKDSDILGDLMDITTGSSIFLYLLSAQSTGLTATDLGDNPSKNNPHKNSNAPQTAQPNNSLQRSVSEPQGQNTAEPRSSQSQGRVQGQGLRTTSTPLGNQATAWTCSRCTFAENKFSSTKCELCDTAKGVYLPR